MKYNDFILQGGSGGTNNTIEGITFDGGGILLGNLSTAAVSADDVFGNAPPASAATTVPGQS